MRNLKGYTFSMIKSFAHKGLERYFLTGSKAGIMPRHKVRLKLILAMLDQARRVEDMDAPGLGLHPLKGDLAGQWAVTVQANWRVIFKFEEGDVYMVDYLDYH
jgi:proteic killer suppression protein